MLINSHDLRSCKPHQRDFLLEVLQAQEEFLNSVRCSARKFIAADEIEALGTPDLPSISEAMSEVKCLGYPSTAIIALLSFAGYNVHTIRAMVYGDSEIIRSARIPSQWLITQITTGKIDLDFTSEINKSLTSQAFATVKVLKSISIRDELRFDCDDAMVNFIKVASGFNEVDKAMGYWALYEFLFKSSEFKTKALAFGEARWVLGQRFTDGAWVKDATS